MGGGEGSTAREILRHGTVDKVTMCDIDEVKLNLICFNSTLPSRPFLFLKIYFLKNMNTHNHICLANLTFVN